MDGTVRAQEFETTPYHAVCCTHCGYDMGYDHINTSGIERKYVDYVTCPECFTEQIKTAANYAPDSWRETNAANSNMADRANESDTETYQVMENITGYRVYDFEFPADYSWSDVSHHEIDWSHRRQIIITWTDGTESRFDMNYGELEDEETHDLNIQDHHGDQVY